MVTWVYTDMKIKEKKLHILPAFFQMLPTSRGHLPWVLRWGRTLLGSKGEMSFRLRTRYEERLEGREVHGMQEKNRFFNLFFFFLRLWIRRLSNSLENTSWGSTVKDLDWQSLKAAFNSTTKSPSKFPSKLHFTKCLYENGLLLDGRGRQGTASIFSIITKVEARSNKGLH